MERKKTEKEKYTESEQRKTQHWNRSRLHETVSPQSQQMSADGMHLSPENFTKQNQVPEPRMETGRPSHTPSYVLANKVSSPQTAGVLRGGASNIPPLLCSFWEKSTLQVTIEPASVVILGVIFTINTHSPVKIKSGCFAINSSWSEASTSLWGLFCKRVIWTQVMN